MGAPCSQILEAKPADAVDLLETSLLVKKTSFEEGAVGPAAAELPDKVRAAAAAATKAIFGTPEPEIDPETGEAGEALPRNDYEAEDLLAHAAGFEALGVGLARSEAYRVMLACKQLGEDPHVKAATVRFFGKFFGRSGDYFVFEATLKEAPEGGASEGDTPAEAHGAGANAFAYFVAQSLGGEVKRLPDVTPAQVRAARSIKRFLTGDLQADVGAYPIFPGKEAEYLRAQIARIAAATVLCPQGYFSLGEDGASLEQAEGYTPGEAEDMSVASWCHRLPGLRQQGRCEAWTPEASEEDEGEAPAQDPEELNVLEGADVLLSGADADAEFDGTAAWTPLVSSQISGVKFQTAGIRSNLWPGAVSVATGNVFANCYVGYGVCAADFKPASAPAVNPEWEGELAESTALPPKPEPEEGEEGEGEGEAATEGEGEG